ncbi:LLM class flavin-dependent oxidoreductase [Roseomonas sp. BN140053]|uniref:LLM class flavin-dependent oxidoreductase n=1 Tax=Roseomonas sp. BN140053 TaxID=3391898 RepID=UPI0039ED4DD7
MDQRVEALRTARNPLFNDRKLKLGTFCTNLSGGCTMSDIPGILQADWPSSLALAQLADAMEFEAIVPVGRWKGFGGSTDFNGAGFECFSWASAMAASTKHSGIFATSHVPTIHPLMAAKQATTIDHVSNGRFTLNVVTGWYQPEIEMFGAAMMEHDRRYDSAAEWLHVIKRLWTEDEPFDFDGEFYHLKQAVVRPKPIQKPHPAVMSAGASTKGRHFAAKYADVGFTNLDAHDLDSLRAKVDSFRELARKEYGREIQVWTNSYIFHGDTEADARRYYHHTVHERGDWEGVENLVSIMGINSQSIPAPALQNLKEHFIAGWVGFPLIGTSDQIVDGLQTLARAGFDGTLLSWPRYLEDMRRFQAETLPLVVQAGLR